MPLRSYAVTLSLMLAATLHGATQDCAALEHEAIPQATLHAAISDGACRVKMTLTPSTDSDIRVELWLPIANWNGKLQGIGNGGYAGVISYDGLKEALRHGYATVSTDTGHEAGGEDATWALNHTEKITDFGYRAIHLMTVDAKRLIQVFYGTPAKYAYFNSCSNGGRQALMEAQRFPADYDGIVAGAPANYWTHLLSNAVSNVQALLDNDASYIPTAKLPAIQTAVQSACDLNDGVKDGVIENPLRCQFDPSVLLCKAEDSNFCLTAAQVVALKKIYTGGHFSDGKSFFPGYPPGGEAGKGNWDAWITGMKPETHSLMYAFGTQFFKNMVYRDANWDFHSFQPDRDVKAADEKMAATLNSNDPDLHPFTSRGGRLILYHGWDDAAIAAPNSIHYYESVRRKLGPEQTGSAVRLFMVPGMQHCFNGSGAFSFGQFGAGNGDAGHDIDTAMLEWVEKGRAPESIIAAKPGTSMTHPLCAYPNTAHFDGKGDPLSASSYTCASDAAK